nr:MAG TPA: hypothetical protein [Caudoviricetes sp.]
MLPPINKIYTGLSIAVNPSILYFKWLFYA